MSYTKSYYATSTLRHSETTTSFTTWTAIVNDGAAVVTSGALFTKIIVTETVGGKVTIDSSKVVGKLGEVLNTPIMSYNGTL